MTSKEFKEKFKVGDSVYLHHWGIGEKITAIGEKGFLSLCGDGGETAWEFSAGDWTKVEPEKKPSEEIQLNTLRASAFSSEEDARYEGILVWLDNNWPKVVKK